ncbi:MAG: hypothetical protein COA69_10920 [Robiginitomaculum sp.]|nr:MAG: hypothetical protein COA69_10920 [Robiginitomaculum sp.]
MPVSKCVSACFTSICAYTPYFSRPHCDLNLIIDFQVVLSALSPLVTYALQNAMRAAGQVLRGWKKLKL